MTEERILRIAQQMEALALGSARAGRRDQLRKTAWALVETLGGEHYVPTVKATLTDTFRYRVGYCPYCYRSHSHTSDRTRHEAPCGGGEYILEVVDD